MSTEMIVAVVAVVALIAVLASRRGSGPHITTIERRTEDKDRDDA